VQTIERDIPHLLALLAAAADRLEAYAAIPAPITTTPGPADAAAETPTTSRSEQPPRQSSE
jgi:hypothetical protein